MLLGSRSLGGKDDSFSAHDTSLLDRLALLLQSCVSFISLIFFLGMM